MEDTMKVGTKIDLDDMLDHIYEALDGITTEYITEVYNNVCFDKVKHIGDDTWEVIENQD